MGCFEGKLLVENSELIPGENAFLTCTSLRSETILNAISGNMTILIAYSYGNPAKPFDIQCAFYTNDSSNNKIIDCFMNSQNMCIMMLSIMNVSVSDSANYSCASYRYNFQIDPGSESYETLHVTGPFPFFTLLYILYLSPVQYIK